MTVPVVRFTVAGHDAQRGLGRPYTVRLRRDLQGVHAPRGRLRKWDRRRGSRSCPRRRPASWRGSLGFLARAYAEALQLIGPNGQTWQGAAAIEQLLRILPKGKLIAWLFKIPFVRVIADRSIVVRAEPISARLRRALSVTAARCGVSRQLSTQRLAHSLTTRSSRSPSSFLDD